MNLRKEKMPSDADGRKKISDETKAKVKEDHETRKMSYANLAKAYGISVGMAFYICNPEQMQQQIKKRSLNWKKYHSKKKDTQKKRKHTQRKANALGIKKRKYTKDKTTK